MKNLKKYNYIKFNCKNNDGLMVELIVNLGNSSREINTKEVRELLIDTKGH